MCYCCNYYAGWSICDQAALVRIRTWTYNMVKQRRGHGPDQIIKQEHMHFITLIHQQTLGIKQLLSPSPFVFLCLPVFVRFAVKFKFRSCESHDAYATSARQPPDI